MKLTERTALGVEKRVTLNRLVDDGELREEPARRIFMPALCEFSRRPRLQDPRVRTTGIVARCERHLNQLGRADRLAGLRE
jgi:hypothetical protein